MSTRQRVKTLVVLSFGLLWVFSCTSPSVVSTEENKIDFSAPGVSQEELDRFRISQAINTSETINIVLTPEDLNAYAVARKELDKLQSEQSGIGGASDYFVGFGASGNGIAISFIPQIRPAMPFEEAQILFENGSRGPNVFYNDGEFRAFRILISRVNLEVIDVVEITL